MQRIGQAERSLGRRHTPVVAVTAGAMPYERQHCLDAGMDDVLVKPYAVTDLPRAVARWAA
jgi:hypothetical protein